MNIENIVIPPYSLKGKWFNFFLESDGTNTILTTSDIEDVIIDGQYLVFPLDFSVQDIIIDFHSIPASSVQSRVVDIQFDTDGKQKVFIPASKNFDYGDIYILGHFN